MTTSAPKDTGAELLNAAGLIKDFPGVRALDGVNLVLRAGSVHALLGENGAGKSTLVKILTGVYTADAGTLTVFGEPRVFGSPLQASRAGIGVVHQERNVIPGFSVAENISLQDPPRRGGVIDRARQRAIAREALDALDVQIDPSAIVGELSVAQVQLVEVAKALAVRSRVLLLDEPTASLTGNEAEKLFEVVQRLRAAGTAIVFVSHKLEEVYQICDTVTVLRDGVSVLESAPLADYERKKVVDLMVGRTLAERTARHRTIDMARVPSLELRHVATALGHEDVSLTVHPGEIVGLYGLVGAGRSELMRSVIGLHPLTGGEILLHGKVETISSFRDALHRFRIGYVTEDRKGEGLFLEKPIRNNIAVTVWRRIARRVRGIRKADETRIAIRYMESLSVRASSPDQLAGQLSGGNQQKVSLAKWLAAETDILVIDEPTVGVDVRTKADFHELIMDLADRGIAIVLISSDLPEMIAVADRVAVMSDYRIVGELANDKDYSRMSREVMGAIHETVPAAS